MKLISADLSPYSAKVRMQIYAMGLTDVEIDLPPEVLIGKLREISPIGRIPVLQTDSETIPESEVIAEYLDEMYPEKAIVGSNPQERAVVRLISRIADVYLMNNIFMALSQLDPATRVDAVVELLMRQVVRGMGALEQHIGSGDYAVGDTLTRADCTLVPALFMCEHTVPRLGIENPIEATDKVAAYWKKIQKNEFAAKVIMEMVRGMKARLDGSEKKMVEEAIAAARAV
ncbi:MAG: glutathione S-transferase N-terminal domain-containing protein [Pseudomonadales bacterium]